MAVKKSAAAPKSRAKSGGTAVAEKPTKAAAKVTTKPKAAAMKTPAKAAPKASGRKSGN